MHKIIIKTICFVSLFTILQAAHPHVPHLEDMDEAPHAPPHAQALPDEAIPGLDELTRKDMRSTAKLKPTIEDIFNAFQSIARLRGESVGIKWPRFWRGFCRLSEYERLETLLNLDAERLRWIRSAQAFPRYEEPFFAVSCTRKMKPDFPRDKSFARRMRSKRDEKRLYLRPPLANFYRTH